MGHVLASGRCGSLGLAACLVLLLPAGARAAPFPHPLHLGEGLECAACHDGSVPGKPAPKRDACTDCHEAVPEVTGGRPWRPLDVPFPHGLHAEAQACRDCHGATADGSRVPGERLLKPTRCFQCHRENGVDLPEARCDACHGPGRTRRPPADHGVSWAERHGREAGWRVFGDHGTDCRLCHDERSCNGCHQAKRPASHTALWRVRLHGTSAGWDRDGCRTCHEPGSCVSCHRRTRPENHRGAWKALHGLAAGSRTSESCATCHSLGWCQACHGGTR